VQIRHPLSKLLLHITKTSLRHQYPITWRSALMLVGTSDSYSIKGPLGVISLCGLGKQISCGGVF
jgi:hypothetical protein